MAYHRIRRLFSVIVVIVLVLVGAKAGENYLEHRIRGTLTEQSPSLNVRSVDFNLYNSSVILKDLQVQPTEFIQLDIDTLDVRPVLSSFLTEKPVIENVILRSGKVTFRQPDSPPQPSSQANSKEEPENAPLIPLVVEGIDLNQLQIHYEQSAKKLTNLGTYQGTIGEISQTSLSRGIDLRLTGRDGSPANGISFDLTTGFKDDLFLSGTLKLTSVNPSPLNYFLNPTKITDGSIGGKIPFTYHRDHLYLNRITIRADNMEVEAGSSPPNTLPDTTPVKTMNTSGTAPVPITMDGVLLSATNSTLSWNGGTIPHQIKLERGAVLSTSIRSLNSTFSADGYLKFAEPEGRLRCQGTFESVLTPLSINPLNCWIKFSNLAQVDPLLGPDFPINVQKGALKGITRGKISAKAVDLNVNLNFSSLSVKTKSPNIILLGIPVNVYLRYLKDNKGELSIQGDLKGPLSEPQFEINQLRNRLLTNLGVDAALIASGGIPILLGDYIINKASGFSPVGTIKTTVERLLGIGSGAQAAEPPKLNIPTPTQQ
jgi:hypothetical protein